MGIRLIRQIGPATAARITSAGVERRTRLRLARVIIVAACHLVLIAQRRISSSFEAAIGGKQLLAVSVAVLSAPVLAAVIRLAAADGKDPEKGSSESKSGTNPDDGKEFLVELAVNTVKLGSAVDSSNHNDGHACGKSSGSKDQYGGYARFEPCKAGDASREVGENANQKLYTKGDERHDEGNFSIFGNLAEGSEGVPNLLG